MSSSRGWRACGARPDTFPCGSRLAGDDVRQIDARLTGPIAGKPAPTGVCVARRSCVRHLSL
ncbi:hypothetical protein CCU68_17750 [Pseudomonas gingeri NCPPB 3146 = LMG 5327]|uniref:Uncharacterized protein n=1 Tax=Pseudomonas gingeri NCPPB 3146 = LMG 5327 TaxID=707248 RepID=A0ABX4Y232_9PSED|nr:hypothetical protein CCU68_17750 [Pseudomonas gingeri NCPPB 3146 = LMG 5327]